MRQNYNLGKVISEDPIFIKANNLNNVEYKKTPLRYEVINFLVRRNKNQDLHYLEIGVRNPEDNFDKIISKHKYSVDPGIEFAENPVDFKMTSDEFFHQLREKKIFPKGILFDIIFIDGLHLAEQVEKDIRNSLCFLNPDGFIVLHDCNPPTEWHAREEYSLQNSPALSNWNGTTWKAFYKSRLNPELSCFCIDSDWGIGIITKRKYTDYLQTDFNPFYEYKIFEKKRKESLNLVTFEEFKKQIYISSK